jgi:hypothetical protein
VKVKREIVKVSGDGDIEVPCYQFSSYKIYYVDVEMEQPEEPTEINLKYVDCHSSTHYGTKLDPKHYRLETSICPDMIPGVRQGRQYYQADVHIAPVRGNWALTISEDLNNRGNQDTTTAPIFIERPPGEP